jgi:hypothetical protein
MLPPKHALPANESIADFVTVYAHGSEWQQHIIGLMPDFVRRANKVFGTDLPHVSFYFFSTYREFRAGFYELLGSSPMASWQTGTGIYRDNRGMVLVSEKDKHNKSRDGADIVMHEYSHALCPYFYGQTYLSDIPSWLNEGLADFLSIPWCQDRYAKTPEIIRQEADAGGLPSYRSLATSIYGRCARAGYALARLMVVDLLRDKDPDVIAYILKETQRRNGDFAQIIQEISGRTPRQLYEKVLLDCSLSEPAVQKRKSAPGRTKYWVAWESREKRPTTLSECMHDLYMWKLETFGRRYRESDIDASSYPHWDAFGRACIRFIQETPFSRMKKSERDQLDAIERLDPGAKLLSYVSAEEFRSALSHELPLDMITYLSRCIENAEHVREELRVDMTRYLERFPAVVARKPMEAFTNESGKFASYRYALLGGDHAAQYDRWSELARSFVSVVRTKPAAQWSQRLRHYMHALTLYDEHCIMPSYCSRTDLIDLLSRELPESLRIYLDSQRH